MPVPGGAVVRDELKQLIRFTPLNLNNIMNGELPLSIGGGIGQSRTFMALLHKAHLGEVSVTAWPRVLTEMCAKRNIRVLE